MQVVVRKIVSGYKANRPLFFLITVVIFVLIGSLIIYPYFRSDKEATDNQDGSSLPQEPESVVTKAMYVIVPHPDDEFQVWSLIENTPDTHKVFVMLTRGERSGYCKPSTYDTYEDFKLPEPQPEGRHSPSCEQARINSFFGFMEAMGTVDEGLPESYDDLGIRGPFADESQVVCRSDDDPEECIVDLTAQLWQAEHATVIWFNLGDGDLNDKEVQWAISTVLGNKSVFGLDSQLIDAGIAGAGYYNASGHSSCHDYQHPDHGAIHAALKNSDFQVGWQAASICGADYQTKKEVDVTDESYFHAFGKPTDDSPSGAFINNYGWLFVERQQFGDYHGQSTSSHRKQTFWIRP